MHFTSIISLAAIASTGFATPVPATQAVSTVTKTTATIKPNPGCIDQDHIAFGATVESQSEDYGQVTRVSLREEQGYDHKNHIAYTWEPPSFPLRQDKPHPLFPDGLGVDHIAVNTWYYIEIETEFGSIVGGNTQFVRC